MHRGVASFGFWAENEGGNGELRMKNRESGVFGLKTEGGQVKGANTQGIGILGHFVAVALFRSGGPLAAMGTGEAETPRLCGCDFAGHEWELAGSGTAFIGVFLPLKTPAMGEEPEAKLVIVVLAQVVVQWHMVATVAMDQASGDVHGHFECFVLGHGGSIHFWIGRRSKALRAAW
jgi:hypothetical protein